MKHTPGPWKAYKRAEPVGFAEYEIHYSDDGECVAEVVHGEADAHLIAAAPDMYEALVSICEYWNGGPDSAVDAIEHAMVVANEALAKAEGREGEQDV